MRRTDSSFEGMKCEEASLLSKETYLPCGQPATHVIYHRRDKRAYLMCMPCAWHNAHNRGGQLVAGPSL